MSNVRSRIVKLINDICAPEKPDLSKPDVPLIGGDIDSLDFASLLMAVEDEFGVVIDEEVVLKVGTLYGLTQFVESQDKV